MRSIRSKLWLGMMILTGAVIILLWLFQIIFLENFYSVFEINNMIGKAEKVVEELEELDELEAVNTSPLLLDELDKLVYERQLTLDIIDESRRVIFKEAAGNNAGLPGSMKTAVDRSIQNSLDGKMTKQQITHPRFGYQFMIIGLPIHTDNGKNGAMLVTMPLASVADTVGILKKQLMIITGLVLIFSMLITFYLSRRFTDPILRISRQADAFMSGHFTIRTKNAGKDEIGRLADRMNKMGDVLMQNEVLQKEFIANVSHELRTPLALIRGYAETLRDVSGENPEKRTKQLNIIVEESRRLNDIVDDILDLSKLQSGTQVLEKETFSIGELLSKIQEHYQLQEGTRALHIEGRIDEQDFVIGDKNRIEQVLRNLIDNAFRHTKALDYVEVNIIRFSDRIRLEITDRGEGIAKEEQEHIFERYYRGKQIDGIKTKGTGLGLAIVKSIMELHQMPYGVVSKPGEGATFWIELETANSHTSF